MAAAANLLAEAPLASPELALVDPELAAELRTTLGSEERWLRPMARADDNAVDASALWDVAEILREAEAAAPERLLVDAHPSMTAEQTRAEAQTRSHYPVLPASETDAEATDATDVALRRIRESLTEADDSPSGKRRIRRGFTLASGMVAACAVAVLGADVQLQVAHLPGWLQF
jgi:hypothetical protein